MATTPLARRGLLAGAAAVAVAVVVVLAGVLGGGDGGGNGTGTGEPPQGTPTTAGGRTPLARDAEQVTRALLDPADDLPAAVASAQGSVETAGGPERVPAVAEIVAVEAGSDDILLRWRLRSAGGVVEVDVISLSAGSQRGDTTGGVVLVDPVSREEAGPYRYRTQDGSPGVCICSISPVNVDGRGQELSGLYPLFSTTPSQVDVRIPGFPPITGVPVTRR